MTEAQERAALLAALTRMGGLAGYDSGAQFGAGAAWELWVPSGTGDGLLYYEGPGGWIGVGAWSRSAYEQRRDLTRAAEFPLPLLRKLMSRALKEHDDD